MGRYDTIHQLQMMEQWRRRTGNATFKGIHKDSRSRKANEEMKRKPYGGSYADRTDKDTN